MVNVIEGGSFEIAVFGRSFGEARVDVPQMQDTDTISLTVHVPRDPDGAVSENIYVAFIKTKSDGSFECLVRETRGVADVQRVVVDFVVMRGTSGFDAEPVIG